MSNYLEELNSAVWEPPAKITEIYKYEDGSISLTLDNSTGFGVEAKYNPERFAVGQTVEVCGGLGQPIKGVRIAGKVIFFKTAVDLEAEHQAWLEKYKAEKKTKYDKNKDAWLKEIEALPEILKNRINRFMKEDENFLLDDQGYELFIVQESMKFTAYFKEELGKRHAEPTMEHAQALFKEFMDKSVEEQKALVDFSSEHSGNTFGGAVAIGMRVAMGVSV